MKKKTNLLTLAISCYCIVGCKNSDDTEQVKSSNASHKEEEKPIQHLKLPDVTSHEEAVKVMKSTTDQLRGKKKLDAAELGEIHIITYSLEKAVAFFADNTSGSQQATAKKMAEVVEEIHLNSENNRTDKTKAALDEYFKLEKMFSENM